MNTSSAVALAFPDIDEWRGLGEYPDWPTSSQIKEILEFARNTGQPEAFHRLCLTVPNLELEHHIVAKLDISLNKRPDETLIWCALCQTWKFADGRLLWTPSEETIRPIGHICARGHFGELRWRQMNEEAERRNKRERDEYYLIDTLTNVPACIATLRKYEVVAQELQTAHENLFKKVPVLGMELYRAANEENGKLIVARKRERIADRAIGLRYSEGVSNFDTVTIATLQGLVFVEKTFRPFNSLRSLFSELGTMCVADTGDDALERVAEMEEMEVSNWAKKLRKLLEQAERLEEKIVDASRFLTPETFNGIVSWLADNDCTCSTHGKMRGQDLWVRDYGNSTSVLFRPLARVIPFV